MTEEKDFIQYCECEACKLLFAKDELEERVMAARRAAGFMDTFGRRPWPRQLKGACRSSEQLAWMYRLTQPIRGKTTQEAAQGLAGVTATSLVEVCANDHDDDDEA